MEGNVNTAKEVAWISGLAAMAGSTVGTTRAILKNVPVMPFAVSTGVNCGMFTATFWLIRESFLTYQHDKNRQLGFSDAPIRDVDDLIASTMAGITTGGLLSAFHRGRQAALPGAVMFGAICAGLQLSYSAANRWRREAILKSDREGLKEANSWWSHIPAWSPVHAISQEEYQELLDTKLKTLEAEIEEIERQLRERSRPQ